jgi:CRP/FNR family transcriptional regulator, cyclic AMP receptor protein
MRANSDNRLEGIPLLASLNRDELIDVARRCRWRRYRPHEQVVDRDSTDSDIYFVVSGAVQIVNYSLAGREVAFAVLPPGSFFGELSAIDGEPRSATAVATKESLLASMPAPTFLQLVVRHPEVCTQLLLRLASIIRTNTERIMDLSTLGAVQRVYVELIRVAEACRPDRQAQWQIAPAPTQKDIAGLASTTRETVARTMSQLIGGGILAREGRALRVLDFDRLQRLAGAMAAELNNSFAS